MSIYSISSILGSLLCLIVSCICFYTRKTKSHIALGWTTLLISIWSLFPFLTTIIIDPNEQTKIARIIYAWAGPAPYAFLVLTLSVIESNKTKFEKILGNVCLGISIFFIILAFHPSFITAIGQSNDARFVKPGPLYPLFIIYFVLVCSWTFWKMMVAYPNTKGLKRNQLKYFFGGFAIAYIGGGIHFSAAYFHKEFFPHDILIATCTIILGYAILRYRLMDFNLIMRWGLAYFLLLLSLLLIALPFLALSEWISRKYLKTVPGFITLIVLSVFIYLFDPIRRKATGFVDKIIFRSPDFKAIFSGLEEIALNAISLNDICSKVTEKFKSIWGINHAGFAIWDNDLSWFELIPTKEFENEIVYKVSNHIDKSDYLVKTLESERRLFWKGIIIESEVYSLLQRASPGERITFEKIRRSMRWLGADICVPLLSSEKLIGFIILGAKMNGGLYNNEDKKFLSHVTEIVTEPMRKLILKIKNPHVSANIT